MDNATTLIMVLQRYRTNRRGRGRYREICETKFIRWIVLHDLEAEKLYSRPSGSCRASDLAESMSEGLRIRATDSWRPKTWETVGRLVQKSQSVEIRKAGFLISKSKKRGCPNFRREAVGMHSLFLFILSPQPIRSCVPPHWVRADLHYPVHWFKCSSPLEHPQKHNAEIVLYQRPGLPLTQSR